MNDEGSDMIKCDANDLLRIIGTKEVLIFQLRLENLRLQRELNELKQAQAQGCDKACQGGGSEKADVGLPCE